MDIDARVEAWASLQLIPGLSSRALVALLKAFGGPAEVMAASRAKSDSAFAASSFVAARPCAAYRRFLATVTYSSCTVALASIGWRTSWKNASC
jgi:hypothetical protein